jgi:hypothetical protein
VSSLTGTSQSNRHASLGGLWEDTKVLFYLYYFCQLRRRLISSEHANSIAAQLLCGALKLGEPQILRAAPQRTSKGSKS